MKKDIAVGDKVVHSDGEGTLVAIHEGAQHPYEVKMDDGSNLRTSRSELEKAE